MWPVDRRVFSGIAWPLLAAAALLLTVTACAPIKLLDAVVPHDGYQATTAVAYGPEARQRLDVYQPVTAQHAGVKARPLVVFFYGGDWSDGSRGEFRFVAQALAARGAVVLVPDYGLSPAYRYPVFVQDSARAAAWALLHATRLGADPQQVYLMGHSSGAYNAAMVALDARWLQAHGAAPTQLTGWIGLAGPYDFLPIRDRQAQVAFNWPDTPADSQPLAHASAASPPALLLAARHDDVVDPRRNTLAMARALRADGVPVRLQWFDDLGHVSLIAQLAAPLRWLGGPVLPPILRFIGLDASVE